MKIQNKLLVLVLALLAPLVALAQLEQIEANNSLSDQAITSSDIIAIAISHPGTGSSADHDWWVAATTPLPEPNHLFFYDGSGWSTTQSVAFQQPLTATDSLEVLFGSGLPAGSYTFYFATDPVADGELDLDNLTYDSVTVTSVDAVPPSADSCGNSKQLFTVDPLDDDAYREIDPLGNLNPSGHTFPTMHTYMMLTNKQVARNVYAPGDITVTEIKVIENLTAGGTDYALNFSSCPEVTGYFDHLSSINQTLLDQLDLEGAANCRQYVAGTDEYDFCYQFVSVDIAVGTLIGTAGGAGSQQAAALDFGLRDTRVTPLFYINSDRVANPDQLYVVCPYDYYVPGPVKAGLYDKLGNARQDLPRCGGVAFDVPGTAQGRWYLAGSSDFGENDHLALAPSNEAPDTVGVISVGNADLGTEAYFFDFSATGLINRHFTDVVSGADIYCWDTLRNREDSIASGSGQAINGIFYLQMTSDTTLTAQRSTQLNQCPANTSSLSFSGSAVQFER